MWGGHREPEPQGIASTAAGRGLIKLLSQEERGVRLAEHRIINLHVALQAQASSSGSLLTRPLIHLLERLLFTGNK